MAQACSICLHKRKADIETALLSRIPLRKIADQYGTSPATLLRHKEHLPVQLTKAQEALEVVQADSLLDQVRGLQTSALRILFLAENAGDLRTSLAAIREARGNLELLAKLMGELQQGVTVNVLHAPQWVTLQTLVLQSLDPYPEARAALAQALSEVKDA